MATGSLQTFLSGVSFRSFAPAFDAWKKTDPLNNPNAAPGPQMMTEYRSSETEEATKLNEQATEVFEQGTRDRQISDEFVRVTVTLATVLLLIAISQRFKTRSVRTGLLIVAVVLLCFPRLPDPSASPGIESPLVFRGTARTVYSSQSCSERTTLLPV